MFFAITLRSFAISALNKNLNRKDRKGTQSNRKGKHSAQLTAGSHSRHNLPLNTIAIHATNDELKFNIFNPDLPRLFFTIGEEIQIGKDFLTKASSSTHPENLI